MIIIIINNNKRPFKRMKPDAASNYSLGFAPSKKVILPIPGRINYYFAEAG